MLSSISIKSLYTLALAEGEGSGTAYEYYAKRLVLAPWLKNQKPPKRLLVAGLPQKYGSSLDFLQLAADFEATVTVVDERSDALHKSQQALAAAQAQGRLAGIEPHYQTVPDLATLAVDGSFDLGLSSEVLQRITAESRLSYLARLQEQTPAAAVFAPNADNLAHTQLSGLSGLNLSDLKAMALTLSPPRPFTRSGYIDMPPFPPGITRSQAQRAQASSGKLEAVAMWGLAYYARLEKVLPVALRRRQSHIVYALIAWGVERRA
jgi:hypothetical protein